MTCLLKAKNLGVRYGTLSGKEKTSIGEAALFLIWANPAGFEWTLDKQSHQVSCPASKSSPIRGWPYSRPRNKKVIAPDL
jgi:hypothetical protein